MKNPNCEKFKLSKLKWWKKNRTLKKSNCDKTQKPNLWHNWNDDNSKTQNVTKRKKSNCEKAQKLKLWQNSKTQIVTKIQKATKLKLK